MNRKEEYNHKYSSVNQCDSNTNRTHHSVVVFIFIKKKSICMFVLCMICDLNMKLAIAI